MININQTTRHAESCFVKNPLSILVVKESGNGVEITSSCQYRQFQGITPKQESNP